MIRAALVQVGMSVVFTGLGLAAGWWMWRPAPAAAPAAEAPHAHAMVVSEQARRNLGIVMGEVKPAPWTRTARFPATVEDLPGSTVVLKAPSSGRIVGAPRRAGVVVAAGEAVAVLEAGAPGDRITLAAPAGPPDWDLVESPLAAGGHVEAGATVAVLRDSRAMRIRAESGGADAALLLDALRNGTACDASPLLAGTGPELKGLKLHAAANDPGGRLTLAVAEASNEVLAARDEGEKGKFRTWGLRAGQRYVLSIPLETVKRTYVVPLDAIATDGPDKVVFLQSGDTFLSQKVVVLYQDARVAVLDARTSGIAPGDVYVERGAPALALALRAGSNVIGHGHPH